MKKGGEHRQPIPSRLVGGNPSIAWIEKKYFLKLKLNFVKCLQIFKRTGNALQGYLTLLI